MLKGEIDIYPEYTGTGWLFVPKKELIRDPIKLYEGVKKEYSSKYGIKWLGLYGFNDTYALVIKKSVADKLNINTYSDLAKNSDSLKFGAEPDFYEREVGYKGLQKEYGFNFKNKTELDIGLKFENVEKSYENGIKIIDDLNFTIHSEEFITLIGKSGCGKTTMLKLINGLIKPDSGKIFISGKEINQWDIIQLRRSIGYVIQQTGLFPHMSIEDNIGYVLNIKKVAKEERAKQAKELIELVGLSSEYLKKYPRELSGGQNQRVGVARALASNPDIILMDEPFGAVDDITRRVLQEEILKIQERLKKTIVFVTHDIDEAFKLGSRIVLFDDGKIVQKGNRKEMIFNPKNKFVEDFFGSKNFTAYLNVTPISEVMITGSEEKNIPSVKEESSLMEGIKILFNYGLESIAVEDKTGKIVGMFSLKHIKESI